MELPKALYAGFYWTLKQLQRQSTSAQESAFACIIAPKKALDSPQVSAPDYSLRDEFIFDLDILRRDYGNTDITSLTMKPAEFLTNHRTALEMVEKVCEQTSLDKGQAVALCESLCRSLAFTQGPPGTGKTYLGVALARVLLGSRPPDTRRPILIICMTNHALDSFLSGLHNAGITSLVRFGSQSKEDWTRPYQMRNVAMRFKRTSLERDRLKIVQQQVNSLATEGRSWCEALNNGALSWPAIREHLHVKNPQLLSRFTEVERMDASNLADIRLARKAGGFAFEFWCQGGDIQDVDQLLEKFNTMLGSDTTIIRGGACANRALNRLHENLRWNIAEVQDNKLGSDIWTLSLPQREELLHQWKREIDVQTILDRTEEIHRRHQTAISRKRTVIEELDIRMLEDIDIIAMTTTACAKHRSMLENLGLKIVICEEAGEVMEAQFLCTLFPSVEHCISIGDPLQLRPQVNEQSLSLETIQGSTYRLDESLMERLMFPANKSIQPIPSSTLNIQRRMHPEIANLMRVTLYPYLEDHESTQDREVVAGLADRVWWLDHQNPEDEDHLRFTNPTSSSNVYEVEMVAGLVLYLVNSNEYDYKDITVLTPYNGQLAALSRRLKGFCSLWLSEKDREALCHDGLLAPEDMQVGGPTDVDVGDMLRLATVDNFQGEESKIVILSTVRSNEVKRVGFMKTPNRINVACSRARNGFYIIGNSTLMRTVPMWHQIIALLASKAKIGPSFRTCCSRHPEKIHFIREPHQWGAIPQCRNPCRFEYPCGHQCRAACHAPSLHDRVGCTAPCERVIERCGHQCPRLCCEPCGGCLSATLSKKLACGHHAVFNCAEIEEGKDIDDIHCSVKIGTITLLCGHEQDMICSETDIAPLCAEICSKLLACGHACAGRCFECNQQEHHADCKKICWKKIPACKHECLSRCHVGSACPPCQHPCSKACEHGSCPNICGKQCDLCVKGCVWECQHEGQCASICCLPCTRFPCNRPCPRTFSCSHFCSSLCGEECSKACIQCTTGVVPGEPQMFLSCGHNFDVQRLDKHVGIEEIYKIDKEGRFLEVVTPTAQEGRRVKASCPRCGESCALINRYALHHRLEMFESVLDGLHVRLYRKVSKFLDDLYSKKLALDSSFHTFNSCLKSGPLTGRYNESRIRERGNVLAELQENIVGFRGMFTASLSPSHLLLTMHRRSGDPVRGSTGLAGKVPSSQLHFCRAGHVNSSTLRHHLSALQADHPRRKCEDY